MKDIIVGTICVVLALFNIVAWSCIGRIWEDQKRCENGATQFCLEEK